MLYTNAPQSDLYTGKSGGPGATDPQGYAQHDSTWFLYAGMNQQITRHVDDPDRGMSVSLSGSYSDQRSNYIHTSVAASMRYRGLFDARPQDWLGFGLTWMDMSNHYARNQQYMNEVSGATDYYAANYQPVACTTACVRFRGLSCSQACSTGIARAASLRLRMPG